MKSMWKKVGEDFGELAEIFSLKVEERAYPTYEAPDDLPRLASDTEKLIYAEEIKIVVKQRSELTRNKRLVYNLMWENISTQIHTEVQKHEKYEDFHRKDPLMFLKVITELVKTSIRGDECKKKTEIKKLYYSTHQGLKTDISTYYEQFKNVRSSNMQQHQQQVRQQDTTPQYMKQASDNPYHIVSKKTIKMSRRV
jgi:hypothetical protein